MNTSAELSSDVQRFYRSSEKIRSANPVVFNDISRLEELFRRAIVRMAAHTLDSLDFHHMDENISKGNLDPRYISVVRNALFVLDPTPWPDRLKDLVSSLRVDLSRLEKALVSRTQRDAETLGHDVHEKEHELSHETTEWLSSFQERSHK